MNVPKAFATTGLLSSLGVWSIYTGVKNNTDILVFNFDGSASMKPIIEHLLHRYSVEGNGKNQTVAFNISAIGSNSGLEKLLNGTSEFALVSHDISHLPKSDTYKDKWKEKSIKTITLATEAMVILYKPPKGCTKEITLSKDNIKKVYSAFSGFNAPNITPPVQFQDLLDEGDKDDPSCKSEIHAWVKSTGPHKSGTAKAFVDNPLFKKKCTKENGDCTEECGEWCKKVIGGYGTDYNLNYAPEATNLHWDSFRHNLKDGAMTYLPSHFVIKNWEQITPLGIKFAKYKKENGEDTVLEVTKDGDFTKHEWIRSYNLLYSTTNLGNNTDKKKLLEFIVSNSKCLSELKLTAKSYTLKNGSTTSPKSICSETANGTKAEEVDLKKPDDTNNSVKP